METRQEITIKNSKGEQKLVKRISLEEARKLGLKSIGSGAVFNLEYCVYLCFKYKKNFFEEADYFAVIQEIMNENADLNRIKCLNQVGGMTVSFFHDDNKTAKLI